MIDMHTLAEEFKKLAAFSPEEATEFKNHVRQQAAYDQRAASGAMSDAEKELHRHHTERVQEYLKKKKDDNYKIPSWARDAQGKPPSSSSSRSSGSSPRPGGYGYGGASWGRGVNWRMGKIASSLGVSATNTLMKISMFEAFCDEMANLSSSDFLDNLFKIAALPPSTLAPGGMMHAESMLAGLAKKTLPRTGRIAGEHNAIVNMARRAGHAGEGGSSIKSLIPGSSKPSMPPASHGFSIPPLSSSAPGATLPPQATIPAPRAA